MRQKKIILTGNNLKINDLLTVVNDPSVEVVIAPESLEKIKSAREFLLREIKDKVVYGVNTGFGPMASYVLGEGQLLELQTNLIKSHAVGMGKPIYASYVLASMVIRLNTLLKGFSGVSEELLERLQTYINKRVIPLVPEHGAVGTSGDLVQLAHVALALMGEGEVVYGGIRQPTTNVLRELSLSPYTLKLKEGLALINGTSTMTGIAAVLYQHSNRLLSLAVRTGALALELVRGFTDSLDERLHNLRPHYGQAVIAEALRKLLTSSQMLKVRSKFQEEVKNTNEADVNKIAQPIQEVYSLRCIPQILGPAFDTLRNFLKCVETEINSVTDNPIIDSEQKSFLHGGNFHGDYIATAIDQLKITLVKTTMLAERRINFFLNHSQNRSFPPFLNLKEPGLTLGLQGLQFVATSTTAQSQSLAFPHSLHSIPTNSDNQDVVSMGTDAALIASKVVENAYIVLAVELISLTQAVDVLGVQRQISSPSRRLYDQLREIFPKVEEDRVIIKELAELVDFLKTTSDLDINWEKN